jgi:hypothetical protein
VAGTELTYPMSTGYVRDWDVPRAVAELVANAVDEDPDARFRWCGDHLEIVDRGGGLPAEALIIGWSSKTDDQIGQFGEGTKIAALVLARELGDGAVTIHTDGWTLRPRIEHRTFGVDDTTVAVLVMGIEPGRRRRGTRVTITCTRAHYDAARSRFLRYTRRRWTPPERTRVTVPVPGRGGRVHVGGVLVCERDDLLFDYDLPARQAKRLLNRDRTVVDTWELRWLTRDGLAGTTDTAVAARWAAAALAGTVSELEAVVPGSDHHDTVGRDRRWSTVRRRLHRDGHLPATTAGWFWRPPGADNEAALDLADRGWAEVVPACDRNLAAELMAALGVADPASTARGGTRRAGTGWVARRRLGPGERAVLNRVTRRLRNRLGADLVAGIRVFDRAPEGCDHWCGFYDPDTGMVAVHRATLADERTCAETLIHELAHRYAHRGGGDFADRTRGFEHALGVLAARILLPEPRSRPR